MAQVLVHIDLNYSDKLVLDNKDAMALMEIFSRAHHVKDTYTDNKLVYTERREIRVESMFNKETMTEEEFQSYKAEKKAAEEEARKVAEEAKPEQE